MSGPPYATCGFLGFGRTPFDRSSVCSKDTEWDGEQCVSTVDITQDNEAVYEKGIKDGKESVLGSSFCDDTHDVEWNDETGRCVSTVDKGSLIQRAREEGIKHGKESVLGSSFCDDGPDVEWNAETGRCVSTVDKASLIQRARGEGMRSVNVSSVCDGPDVEWNAETRRCVSTVKSAGVGSTCEYENGEEGWLHCRPRSGSIYVGPDDDVQLDPGQALQSGFASIRCKREKVDGSSFCNSKGVIWDDAKGSCVINYARGEGEAPPGSLSVPHKLSVNTVYGITNPVVKHGLQEFKWKEEVDMEEIVELTGSVPGTVEFSTDSSCVRTDEAHGKGTIRFDKNVPGTKRVVNTLDRHWMQAT